jgi:UV DNA damage repair endonuclease
LATHALTQKFYAQPKIERAISHALAAAGKFARQYNIRLSFHPGQFVVLGSQSKNVRENSVRELEYHCEMFDKMGYKGWHPNGLSVNVHVGLKDPNVSAMRTLLQSRSSSVKNFITLENDEFSWGAESIVDTFGDIVPLVLDVHHYWIHEGKRLQPNTKFIDQIRYTWRGVQPKLHLAISHQHLCGGVKPHKKLELQKLLDAGNTRAGLRAHCEDPWHTYSIDYAAQFGFDIMWEGKNKNLGAVQIAKHLKLI